MFSPGVEKDPGRIKLHYLTWINKNTTYFVAGIPKTSSIFLYCLSFTVFFCGLLLWFYTWSLLTESNDWIVINTTDLFWSLEMLDKVPIWSISIIKKVVKPWTARPHSTIHLSKKESPSIKVSLRGFERHNVTQTVIWLVVPLEGPRGCHVVPKVHSRGPYGPHQDSCINLEVSPHSGRRGLMGENVPPHHHLPGLL